MYVCSAQAAASESSGGAAQAKQMIIHEQVSVGSHIYCFPLQSNLLNQSLVLKSYIVDNVLNWAKFKADQEIKKTDSSKRQRFAYLSFPFSVLMHIP
jgi:hypothetical protein